MPIAVAVPRLGWNMEEGTFVEWLKADGEVVRPGDFVYKLEGEKSVEEIESLDGGVLHIPPTAPQPGARVAVGAVIAHLLQPGEAPPACVTRQPVAASSSGPTPPAAEPVASPSVRRLARERGVDLRDVSASGRAGRHTADDVERATRPAPTPAASAASTISPRARRLASRHGVEWATVRGTGKTGRIRERDIAAALAQSPAPVDLIPLTAARKVTAARMVESLRSTAPVTLTAVADATNLVNLRGQFKAAAEAGLVPTFTDFLVKLAAVALQKHPMLAAQWTDAGLRPAERIDIGIAVDADGGLFVPVVRDVPALGLRQVAAASRELIDRARSGALATRDMAGGCFTITNLGGYGIDAFTPIINPPQTAILGVGRIDRRPAVDGDRVVGRDAITLSLTFDHRVVDGGPAARFLQTLVQLIANPAPWLST